MTTSPVVSVTDELIAELEDECRSGVDVYTPRGIMRALLAERAGLKRDAERYRWLREHHNDIHGSIWVSAFNREQYDWVSIDSWFLTGDSADDLNLDAAIDAAMQS